LQQPGERDLPRRRLVPLCDRGEHRLGFGEPAGAEREPRDEADAVALAVREHVLAVAVDDIVAVLHGGDGEHLGRRLDVGDRHLAQAGEADDLVIDELADGGELLVARHLRVDAVELPQVDAFDAEIGAALLRLGDQVVGSAARHPVAGAGPRQAGLGGDDEAIVRGKHLADEPLRHLGAVRVGRIDESDAELRHAFERAQRLRAVGGLAPDAGAGDAHGAEAEAVHLQLAADPEGAGGASVGRLGVLRHIACHGGSSIAWGAAAGASVLNVCRHNTPPSAAIRGRDRS